MGLCQCLLCKAVGRREGMVGIRLAMEEGLIQIDN